MSEEISLRQNCCRLCLAPDNECISILNSFAADKEPLCTKIQNCVGIMVTANDRLSLRICHACISYLNSWQSFKNRCYSSQTKQRHCLNLNKNLHFPENNNNNAATTITTISGAASDSPLDQQHQQHLDRNEDEDLSSSILDGISSLKKRKSLTVYPLPVVQVKEEPIDHDESYMHKMDDSEEMVDPTMFLERTVEEEGEEPISESTRFAYEHENELSGNSMDASLKNVSQLSQSTGVSGLPEVKEAACRACNLKFSTRANARRHERNLHPNLFELSTTNNVPVTKPIPALAAALELQRAAAFEVAAKHSTASISAQKLRQEVVNAFNNCEGSYDYDNPEKYRHLLTDEKLIFIQQNEEFLQQYQNMTCKCCNRCYTSYKNFMAHMRKKYTTLPRNLCFNCLKLNDSKALFISHLKRRNCINLYKILHAMMAKSPSFAADVQAQAAAMPDKLRAKELLVNKMYECKLCPKHFRLKLEFRSHVYCDHSDLQRKDVPNNQCSFCGSEFDDLAERKRHYNNMDCIVSLRCVTCGAKFDKHQKFLDHVYSVHLAGFGEQETQGGRLEIAAVKSTVGGTSSNDDSRSSQAQTSATPKSQYFSRQPQSCLICGQKYNNYNNVLRHMESKHPNQLPQTYKCSKCSAGYPRLSLLREHMITVHDQDKIRHTGFEYIVNAAALKIDGGGPTSAYTGRYDYVMKDLMSITNGGNMADDDDNNEGQEGTSAKRIRLDNSAASNNNTTNQFKECPICSAIFNNNIGLSNHMRSHTAAAQNAASAGAAARSVTNSSTNASVGGAAKAANQDPSIIQKAILKRSLDQAAERRFRRMRCRICQRRFCSKKSYRLHMLNDHHIRNVQFIKCKLCDAEFAYEKGLKVHMFKIHNTLLKDDMIVKQYECDICSIVYRSEEQLLQHKASVHGSETAHANSIADDSLLGGNLTNASGSGLSTPVSNINSSLNAAEEKPSIAPLYWYQCKYCASNFNTNKKLAIHINSHDEFDSNDYSCKDCGNVYSGRKSLWVHRYKKHPQIADPSECVLCRKVFFDSQMLRNHIPTCNRKPITATGAMMEPAVFKHKTGDDEDGSRDAANEVRIPAGTLGGGQVEVTAISTTANLKIKLPEVSCTICGLRFSDQELFSKHIQMHEMELYTDNPLAAMFDTGPADPNQFFLDRVNDNGEYACDLCAKTFTQMTALKVHRKWHFRGDSKQNLVDADHPTTSTATNSTNQTSINPQRLQGLQAVGLMPRPPSKSHKRKLELKCEYCPSTFISNNNLRRHIYELHKEAITNLPEPPEINLDHELHCNRCSLKFETKKEWIEHKVSEARVMKPFGPFQWGCDLCGAYVSRKEKLIYHIQNHLKENVIIPIKQQREKEELQKQILTSATASETSQSPKKPQMNILQQEEASLDKEDEYEEDGEEAEDLHHESESEIMELDGEYDAIEEVEAEEEDPDADADADSDTNVDDDGIFNNVNENANDGLVDGEEEEEAVAESASDIEDEEEDDDDDATTNDSNTSHNRKSSQNHLSAETTESEDSHSAIEEDEADDDDEAEEDGVVVQDEDTVSSVDEKKSKIEKQPIAKARFSCDLCQYFFNSQLELQKHVQMHFFNGPGSVSLTEIKRKSSVNKSRSSSSDVITVSSS